MTTTSPSKPSEVGWQFVSQYYTFVNKQPGRLHCFYTKNSAFIHGIEGEDGRPCYGQHEIHEKILSIGFQDCKVYIHSVDAQASANSGIIVQVIGEMSNNNEAWRKFAQTFFLAEQPNGYFVLNDIFRYLKEDTDEEGVEEEEEAIAAGVVDEHVVPEPAPGVEHNFHPNPQQQSRAEPPPNFETPSTLVEAPVEPAAAPFTNGNGVHHESPPTPDPVAPAAEPTPEPEEEPAPVETPAEPSAPATPPPEVATPAKPATPAPPAPVEEPVESPAPAAPSSAPAPPAAEPTPAPAPRPAAPEKPKTWANLAASRPNAWGPALAADSKGVSAAAAPSPTPTPARANGPHTRTASNASPAPEAQGQSPAAAQAMAVTTGQCFVKVCPFSLE